MTTAPTRRELKQALDALHGVAAGCGRRAGARHLKVFDRYFDAHPLVREHGRNQRAVTRRISDLYNDYYRPSASTTRWRCPSTSTGGSS